MKPFPIFAAVLLLLAVPLTNAQPRNQINCNAQSCTFTLSFDKFNNGPPQFVTGAPYSGQQTHLSANTLRDGTHTSVSSSGPTTFRDSKGRIRTEQSAYPAPPPGRPAQPDDFIVTEIWDPVSRLMYILDPVNQLAHRMAYDPGTAYEWHPQTPRPASTTTMPDGSTNSLEPLGTQTMSGVETHGLRMTRTPASGSPNAGFGPSTQESWTDPRTGVYLMVKNTTRSGEVTTTMENYSAVEPAPALFRIPDGYQVVKETGPFQVIHTRRTPNSGISSVGSGLMSGLSTSLNGESCTITFEPATGAAADRPERAITEAPYSGTETILRAASPGFTTYRDSKGRTLRDPAPVMNGACRAAKFAIVEILDPVAEFRYLLDTANRTAYRVPLKSISAPFQPGLNFGSAGTNTRPDGVTSLNEDLGTKTLFGVIAQGFRSTQTYPTGTYNGNDKPVTMTNERWIDPKTGVVLLVQSNGPNGESGRSIPDYKSGDPNPALFKIPDGYKIVDEPGKFSFNVALPK